jgi:hypothetical protein
LKTAAKGRPSNAPLLLQKDGKLWSETDPSSGYKKGVRATAKKVGLDPDVYGLYAFRHTSITRMLLKGIHTSIVAKAHDTSEGMIRKHYAASILDFTDEITRKALLGVGADRAGSRQRHSVGDEALNDTASRIAGRSPTYLFRQLYDSGSSSRSVVI